MPREKKIHFYDFSGGLNVSSPESKLEPNEFRRMLNMVPGLRGHELVTRPILSTSEWSEALLSSFTPSKQELYGVFIVRDWNKQEHLWIVHSDGNTVVAKDVSHGGSVVLKNGGAEDPIVEIIDFQMDSLIIMCGNPNCISYHIQYSAPDGAIVATPLTNENGGDGAPINGEQPIVHGGRIFAISPYNSIVFCGVSIDIPDYLNWGQFHGIVGGVFSDATDDGGEVIISPVKQKTTRLETTPDGIIVFKETSTHMWVYPPDAHPSDAASGAEVVELSRSVGCVDPKSVVNINGALYFVGNSIGGVRSLYVLNGSEIEKVSQKVDRIWQSFSGSISAAVSGGIIYFFGDDGMFLLFNLESGAFSECSNTELPRFIGVAKTDERHNIVGFNAGGLPSILRIPTTSEQFISDEIIAEVLTPRIFPEEPTGDIRTSRMYLSHKYFDTLGARVASKMGSMVYDGPGVVYDMSTYELVEYEIPDAEVSFEVGNVDSGFYDSYTDRRVFVSSRYDEPYEAGVFYDSEATYHEDASDTVGYYLNRKTDRLSARIRVKTRGKYAMDGFSILYRESGEIDKPKNAV